MAPQADVIRFILARIRVDPASDCWRWTGNLNPAGYGRCNPAFAGGKTIKAHRLAYETFVGPIPPGLTVDHLCYVRDCVNPDHLQAVTVAENSGRAHARSMSRRAPRAVVTCENGHPCYACQQ